MNNLRYLTIAGNVLFLLFFLHNAIDEGGGGTPVEMAAQIGLTLLLILNIVVLARDQSHS